MKKCNKCGSEKDLSCFYKTSNGALSNTCKECAKLDSRNNRKNNIDYYRAFDKKRSSNPDRVSARASYSKTDNGIASMSKSRKKYITNNPDKRKAHIAVGNAVRDGFLIKKPCFSCGSSINVQAHHEDYSKPLDVVWLCVKCHRAEHGQEARYNGCVSKNTEPLQQSLF